MAARGHERCKNGSMKTEREVFELCDRIRELSIRWPQKGAKDTRVFRDLLPQKGAKDAKYSMKTESAIFKLCDQIREISFSLHRFLRHGHLEKVYENGLSHRLKKIGIKLEQQHPLQVRDEDGTILGDYVADPFGENCLIVELKACQTLANEHIAQLFGYLQACRIEHGLLINFGAQKLQIKKYALSDNK